MIKLEGMVLFNTTKSSNIYFSLPNFRAFSDLNGFAPTHKPNCFEANIKCSKQTKHLGLNVFISP